jgi:O-methyltransferase
MEKMVEIGVWKSEPWSLIKQFKKVIKYIFELAGYQISLIPNYPNGYEKITPIATYAPWQLDDNFKHIYDIIKYNTMVDIYRCYELWQLVSQSITLGGSLLEVGVWRGGTGGLIAKRVELSGKENKVYLADTFEGVVKTGEKDQYYKGGEHADTSQEIVNELLADKLQLTNFKILKGIFPDDTSHLVDNEEFCFCHIDVDVYNSAKDIVNWIWPKLIKGGIIVFDDYGFITCDGLTTFVNEEYMKKDRIIIYNINGHAILIKIK